jgi:hypothetical protein
MQVAGASFFLAALRRAGNPHMGSDMVEQCSVELAKRRYCAVKFWCQTCKYVLRSENAWTDTKVAQAEYSHSGDGQ